jgi:hypothetical protein
MHLLVDQGGRRGICFPGQISDPLFRGFLRNLLCGLRAQSEIILFGAAVIDPLDDFGG